MEHLYKYNMAILIKFKTPPIIGHIIILYTANKEKNATSLSMGQCFLFMRPLLKTLLSLFEHVFLLYITLVHFSYCSWSSRGKNTGVVCHSLFQWATFCQNSPLWLVRLGVPCTTWLIASLSYASPFTMTRQWSMRSFQYWYIKLLPLSCNSLHSNQAFPSW